MGNIVGTSTPIASVDELAATGRQFPPLREGARVQQMDRYYRFSRDDLDLLFPGEKPRLKPGLFSDVMDFWEDAVMSDTPVIKYRDNNRAQEFIEAIAPAIHEAARNVVGDMIRYGVGCFINRRPLQPQSVDPRYWFPVRSASDVSEIIADIVAYPFVLDPNRGSPDAIRIMVYQGDEVFTSWARLEGLTIGETFDTSIAPSAAVTPEASLAVIPVVMGRGLYGTSQFGRIEAYVKEISNRETRVSEALDKQANPHLAIPESAIRYDEKGQAILDLEGMMIPYPEGTDLRPQYIVWDPSFQAQEASLQKAEQRIQELTKISRILIDPTATGGQIPSGSALRRLAIVTVNRIRTIRGKLNEAYRDVIVGAADLAVKSGQEGVVIERDKIHMLWPPELSGGITDDSDALSVLVNSGIIDEATAAQLVLQSSRRDAEQEAEQSDSEREMTTQGAQERANDGQDQ